MKITFEQQDSFKQVSSGDSTGFYVDIVGGLYLVHLNGVSKIQTGGGTLTFERNELQTPLRKIKTGERVTIEF